MQLFSLFSGGVTHAPRLEANLLITLSGLRPLYIDLRHTGTLLRALEIFRASVFCALRGSVSFGQAFSPAIPLIHLGSRLCASAHPLYKSQTLGQKPHR